MKPNALSLAPSELWVAGRVDEVVSVRVCEAGTGMSVWRKVLYVRSRLTHDSAPRKSVLLTPDSDDLMSGDEVEVYVHRSGWMN